jgi:FecR protein
MLRSKGMLLALIVALSVLLVPLSRAQDEEATSTSHARIVRLSYAEGTVELATDRGTGNATINVPITEGNRLSTNSNGWAEVQLEDGSTVRIAPSTQLTFTELGRAASGSTLTTVDLDQGEAEFKVSRQNDDKFAVTARNKTVLVKHSGHFRVTSLVRSPLEIVVFKGEVSVGDSNSGQQVAVKKGETFALDALDLSHYALNKQTEKDELDRWSEQRDESLSAYASRGGGNYGQSPYQYGLNDLSYYGSYYSIPGYGYLWQPYGAGFGWDPFMNGYWSDSPFGYCWVSAYPWGWLPYRYGNWIFVNGYGWMWQPGSWSGWWRQPRLVNAPPGFHPPAPPPPGRTGIVTRTGEPGQPPRISSQPGIRPRRVFNNEDVQSTLPVNDRATRELNGRGTVDVIHADRKPAMVDRQTPESEKPATAGSVGEIRRGPPAAPAAAAAAQPSAPVIHAQPAPATVPSRPASSPPAAPAPAPAPHVSSPPPAPRSINPPSSPPSAPRSEGGSVSRGSAPTSSGRPK